MNNETATAFSIKFAARAAFRAFKCGDQRALEVWANIVKEQGYLIPLFEGGSFSSYERYQRFIYAIAP